MLEWLTPAFFYLVAVSVCTFILVKMLTEAYWVHRKMYEEFSYEYDRMRLRRYLVILWAVPFWGWLSPIIMLVTALGMVAMWLFMGAMELWEDLMESVDVWKATKK